jgi:hypothetical protein
MSPRQSTSVRDLAEELKLAHKNSAIKNKEFYNSSLINSTNKPINNNSQNNSNFNNTYITNNNLINNNNISKNLNDYLLSRKNSKNYINNTNKEIKTNNQISANAGSISTNGTAEKRKKFLYNFISKNANPNEAEFKILSARLSRKGSEKNSSIGRMQNPNAKIIENLLAKNFLKEPSKIHFNSNVKSNNNTNSNISNKVNLFQNSTNSNGNLIFNSFNTSIKISADAQE